MIGEQGKLISWNNNRFRGRRKRKMMDTDLIGKVRTTATISDLPEELLTQVLVRLPLKDIWACVRVQKSWHSLIKTRMFITLHSNYQISSSNPNKYLLFWNCIDKVYELRIDDIQCQKYLTLKFPVELPHFLRFSYRLVSNGLICMYEPLECPDTDVNLPIYLWNPVIQKHRILPNSPHTHEHPLWKAIAFGFVPEINDYLVVYIVKHGLRREPHTHSFVTCVYSLNANSWRKITHDNIPDVDKVTLYDSSFVNGVAVWSIAVWGAHNSQWNGIIMCFDTKTDVLRAILLPKCVHRFPGIHPFGQSVVYFAEDRIDDNKLKLGMWVSKGDLMNEVLWENKVMKRFQEDAPVLVMGLRNNGDPILYNSYGLISYNLDSHEFYDFFKSWDHLTWDHLTCLSRFFVKPFVESLGSLNIN